MNGSELSPVHWRKSTHSGADEAECVEIADLKGYIGIRDNRAPEAGHLTLSRKSFAALLGRLAARS